MNAGRDNAELRQTVVCVVNYRTPDRVAALLMSFISSGTRPLGIIIVDNASGDGSASLLQTLVEEHHLASWVHVHALSENLGFAGGNNAAIAQARRMWPVPKYWFLLNPDTLLESGAIRALEAHLDRNPRAGIAGSQVEDASGAAQASGHVGDGPLAELPSAANLSWIDQLMRARFKRLSPGDAPEQCDWVSGAALMVREATFREIGQLDEGFFLYFEEADLCRRARRGGWGVWLVPASRIVHIEGSSTGIRTGRRPRYWFASRQRYFVKHFSVLGLLAADVSWVLGRALNVVVNTARGRSANHLPEHFTPDLLLGDMRAILTGAHSAWKARSLL